MTDEDIPETRGSDGETDDKYAHLEGNDHAEGNPGGSAPPANQNATTHGMYADPDNLLAWLEENDPAAVDWIKQKYTSYLKSAPFGPDDAKADQLKQIVVRELSIWRASGLQIREGVVTEQPVQGSDGEWFVAKKENPANQALSRLERDVTKRLKELGVLGESPDARMAGAMEMRSDDYVIEVDDGETLEDCDEWVIERPNEDD